MNYSHAIIVSFSDVHFNRNASVHRPTLEVLHIDLSLTELHPIAYSDLVIRPPCGRSTSFTCACTRPPLCKISAKRLSIL